TFPLLPHYQHSRLHRTHHFHRSIPDRQRRGSPERFFYTAHFWSSDRHLHKGGPAVHCHTASFQSGAQTILRRWHIWQNLHQADRKYHQKPWLRGWYLPHGAPFRFRLTARIAVKNPIH